MDFGHFEEEALLLAFVVVSRHGTTSNHSIWVEVLHTWLDTQTTLQYGDMSIKQKALT